MWEQIRSNQIRSVILVAGMGLLLPPLSHETREFAAWVSFARANRLGTSE